MSTRSPRIPSSASKSAPRATPSANPTRAERCRQAFSGMAEATVTLSDALMTHAVSPTDLASRMGDLIKLRLLAGEMIAATVVQQRSQGEPLDDFASMLELSTDRLRKKYNPTDVDQRLTARAWPKHVLTTVPSPAEPPDALSRLRDPHHRLACALTLTFRASGMSQRELATHMGIDRSYVSRLLSGHREASWQHVTRIAGLCRGNEDLLKSLWAAANGRLCPEPDPSQALHTYLKALHYAAGSPTEDAILTTGCHTLTALQLSQALDGPGTPSWPVVRKVTLTLHGIPTLVLPLWKQAASKPTASSVAASAFG
ncbi:helix-turn-helix domain-containing protein [Streptomyces sp. NPDC002454]